MKSSKCVALYRLIGAWGVNDVWHWRDFADGDGVIRRWLDGVGGGIRRSNQWFMLCFWLYFFRIYISADVAVKWVIGLENLITTPTFELWGWPSGNEITFHRFCVGIFVLLSLLSFLWIVIIVFRSWPVSVLIVDILVVIVFCLLISVFLILF